MYSKKQRIAFKIIALVIAVAMILTSFAYVFAEAPQDRAALHEEDIAGELGLLSSLMQYIHSEYVYDVSYQQLVDGAFTGVFQTLDPYSEYYPSSEEFEAFVQTVQGEFAGIGVRLESYGEGSKALIVNVFDGSPAMKAGLKAGDIITAVDGKTTDYPGLSARLRGQEGTQVSVSVLRGGTQTLTFTMKRQWLKAPSVFWEMKTQTIGYIALTDFDDDTDREFAKALAGIKAKGAKSFILDMRNNSGGLIETALGVANQLIPNGKPVFHFMKKGAVTNTFKSSGEGLTKMPYVVLVNQYSASAAEILAGAVQDHKTAKLVGAQTYGKGVGQAGFSLDNGGGVKLTITSFVTPNKRVIDGIGLAPDVAVTQVTVGAVMLDKAVTKAFAPMTEEKSYQPGEQGLNVYAAQQRLQYLGHAGIQATGFLDANTEAGLKTFQASKQLAADGALSIKTRDALAEAAAHKTAEFEKKAAQDLQLNAAMALLEK